MKKIVALLLAGTLLLALCACSHEHEYGDWGVVSPATCTEEGSQERTCTICGEKETEAIPASHSFGEWEITKEASCEEDGVQERTCSVCGEKETETIPATGHDFEKATYLNPKTCKNCGVTEGEALATVVSIGSDIETDDHSFTVLDVFFASKVTEPTSYGTISSSEGNFCIIKLSFCNKSTEIFESFHSSRASEMTLTYDDKYEYTGEVWCSDEIVPLGTKNLYVLYSVPPTMKNDKSKSISAVFGLDNEIYAISICEGDGSNENDDETASEKNTERIINIGDTRSDSDLFQFTVSKMYFAKQVKESSGYASYLSQEGNFLVLELDFTNLSTTAFEQWHSSRLSNLKLHYDNKYDYDGDYFIAFDDIVPLGTSKLYLLYDVVDTIKSDSTSPLIAEFTIDGSTFEIDCQKNL